MEKPTWRESLNFDVGGPNNLPHHGHDKREISCLCRCRSYLEYLCCAVGTFLHPWVFLNHRVWYPVLKMGAMVDALRIALRASVVLRPTRFALWFKRCGLQLTQSLKKKQSTIIPSNPMHDCVWCYPSPACRSGGMLATRRMVYKLLSRVANHNTRLMRMFQNRLPLSPISRPQITVCSRQNALLDRRRPRRLSSRAILSGSLKKRILSRDRQRHIVLKRVPARCAQDHPCVSRMTNQRTLFG